MKWIKIHHHILNVQKVHKISRGTDFFEDKDVPIITIIDCDERISKYICKSSEERDEIFEKIFITLNE